jgi:hypothetical protein
VENFVDNGGLTIVEVYVSSGLSLQKGKLLSFFPFIFNDLHVNKFNFPLRLPDLQALCITVQKHSATQQKPHPILGKPV